MTQTNNAAKPMTIMVPKPESDGQCNPVCDLNNHCPYQRNRRDIVGGCEATGFKYAFASYPGPGCPQHDEKGAKP